MPTRLLRMSQLKRGNACQAQESFDRIQCLATQTRDFALKRKAEQTLANHARDPEGQIKAWGPLLSRWRIRGFLICLNQKLERA